MSVTVKSPKKGNDSLREQIKALFTDFKRLEMKLKQGETSTDNGQHDANINEETKKSLEFYSKSYDDLNTFKQESATERRLDNLTDKVGSIAKAIEESQQYSNRYS